MAERTPQPKVGIRDSLIRLERGLRERGRGAPYDRDIAGDAGMSAASYSQLKKSAPGEHREPSLRQLLALARRFRVPPEALLDDPDDLYYQRNGVCWRLTRGTAGPREAGMRRVAASVLEGDSPKQAREHLRLLWGASDRDVEKLDASELRWMARGAFGLGLVELAPPGYREGALDADLARDLAEALRGAVPRRSAPRVRVVRNVADPDFIYDPAAPFLIAQAAHALVADFLREHPRTFTIGIAGGLLVSAFVHAIGSTSSPFPDAPASDKRFDLVPLTLEPMYDHHHYLADALVGELAARASYLLGPKRVMAPSFKPFGTMHDREMEKLTTESVVRVRAHYSDLGVAIFGCGDSQEDGWIRTVLRDRGVELDSVPETDVCLNMLTKGGEPIPLPDAKQRNREYMGVSLRDIQRVAERPDKLGLLLTSSAVKGSPLVSVFEAGCANALVCDQAAARAALERLAGRRAGRAAAPGGPPARAAQKPRSRSPDR